MAVLLCCDTELEAVSWQRLARAGTLLKWGAADMVAVATKHMLGEVIVWWGDKASCLRWMRTRLAQEYCGSCPG